MEKFNYGKGYMSVESVIETRQNEIEYKIKELKNYIKAMECEINELHMATRENDERIRLLNEKLIKFEKSAEHDFMLVGIVDCLLLALIGVTALIF